MTWVESPVTCPICGGECQEDYNCNTDYASYCCFSCGYYSNSCATMKELNKSVPKDLKPFIIWADMEKCGGVVTGRLPWWPGGIEYMGEYSLHPVVIGRQLRWRRQAIEEIPEAEQKNYPLEDGKGVYKYRAAALYADYEKFYDARTATREDQLARAILQENQISKEIELLHTPKSTEHKQNGRKAVPIDGVACKPGHVETVRRRRGKNKRK